MDYVDMKNDGRLISTEMSDPMAWVADWLPGVVEKANKKAQVINTILAENFGALGEFKIDEVALHFRTDDELEFQDFLLAAVQADGYELFNTAWDKVQTYPIRSRYFVNYAFLRTPYDFRLECMRVDKGVSPLHTPMDQRDDPKPVVVHYSFKCPDPSTYNEVLSLLDDDEDEFARAMTCRSDYGMFSYWITAGTLPVGVFLKPRANLRDGGGRSNHDSGTAIDINANSLTKQQLEAMDREEFGSPGLGRGIGSLIRGIQERPIVARPIKDNPQA